MAKMGEIRVGSLMISMLALMAMLVSPSHAQAVDFDISCFLKCAASCIKHPTLECLTKCLTGCVIPDPSPTPSPSPPTPEPTSPDSVNMPAPAGLKSCNFECALRDCTSIETDMKKQKCMEDCFKVSCDTN